MNVSYLHTNIDALLNHMRISGYSVTSVKACRTTFNYIIRLSSELSWDSYDDVRAWTSGNEEFSDKYRNNLQIAIKIIERFDIYHELPIHPVDQNQMSYCSHSAGQLDLLPLKERMMDFEKSMIEKEFRYEYIKRIKQCCAKIIVTARMVAWDSFEDIRTYYNNSDLSKTSKQCYLLAINKMEDFLNSGKVSCHRNAPHCIEDATPSLGALNLLELKNRLPELQQYMEDNQYTAPYIRKVILKAEKIIVLSGKIVWNSYQDILDWYRDQGYDEKYIRDIRTIVGIMSALHLYNIFPNNHATQHPLWPRENNYQKLIPVYRKIVDYGCETQRNRGLQPSSVERAKCEASSFFFRLQERGVYSLETVTEEDVLAVFRNGLNSRSVLHSLSRFIRDCIPLNTFLFRRIDEYIPVSHKARKTIQYLTTEESNAFQEALEDMNNDLSLKQRAVGTILFYTGMRASDVANLQIDSVDLKKGLLEFIQVKTGEPVKLPLLPTVGNAIYDYCSMERPLSNSPAVFLGKNAPFHTITAGSIGYIVGKIMDRAQIRMNPGDRRGSHIFRHRAATKMAENNIPAPVISATLGHSSPKSLDSYLSADLVHLKECAIDLGDYTIPKEVFACVSLQ